MDSKQYYNSKEVQEYLNISPVVLAQLRKSGKLPFKKISSKSILYLKSDVQKLMKEDNDSEKLNIVYYKDEAQKHILTNYANCSGVIPNEFINNWDALIKKLISLTVNKIYIIHETVINTIDYANFNRICSLCGAEIINLNNKMNKDFDIKYIQLLRNVIDSSDLRVSYKTKILFAIDNLK